MKKFFVSIWKWILSIFKKKEVVVRKETLAEKLEKRTFTPYHQQEIPQHNNRKRTRGRHIQVDPTTGRTIYHAAQ